MPSQTRRPRQVSKSRLGKGKEILAGSMSETELVKACLEQLHARKLFAFRMNTGAFKTELGHFVRFGAKGAPDIILVRKGRFIGIECKAKKGKQSPGQKEFQDNLEQAGGLYWLVYSIDELISHL